MLVLDRNTWYSYSTIIVLDIQPFSELIYKKLGTLLKVNYKDYNNFSRKITMGLIFLPIVETHLIINIYSLFLGVYMYDLIIVVVLRTV